jgi:hypothetical protein
MDMAANDQASVPLQFSAIFPCDQRFAPAVADLFVKVAQALGYSEAEAREFGRLIDEAFGQAAANGASQGEVQVDVTLRAAGEAIDASVRCAHRSLLELTRPHSD